MICASCRYWFWTHEAFRTAIGYICAGCADTYEKEFAMVALRKRTPLTANPPYHRCEFKPRGKSGCDKQLAAIAIVKHPDWEYPEVWHLCSMHTAPFKRAKDKDVTVYWLTLEYHHNAVTQSPI